jgi:adenylate cyclase
MPPHQRTGVLRDLNGMAALLRQFELDPTDDAPASGRYELLNIFGTPTSEAVSASEGERLPAVPLGYTWQSLKNIARPLRVYRVGLANEITPKIKEAETGPCSPSIAVLAFTNMSGDPEQDYFADGMVEEIITALSRITWLFVIARN